MLVVPGTFMGDDPLALSEILSAVADEASWLKKLLAPLAQQLKQRTKPLTDRITKDIGNYSADFCARFQGLVGADPLVALLDPMWTGQNHHLARADLAVRLLCELDELQPAPQQHVLLWGHSHAGNGFAILSNLLANDPDAVERFFAAGPAQEPHWKRARHILYRSATPHPWARSVLMAAFGTPVRYGWDVMGYRHLVHVLHHRDYDDQDSPFRTRPLFPPHSAPDVLNARYGDWVQAFGIAGTDVASPPSIDANRKLAAVLEFGLDEPEYHLDTLLIKPDSLRTLCERWKAGTRCHADGLNLLVEYEPCGRRTPLATPIEESVLGHGVATTIDWLPAHLNLVMEAFMRQEAVSGTSVP